MISILSFQVTAYRNPEDAAKNNFQKGGSPERGVVSKNGESHCILSYIWSRKSNLRYETKFSDFSNVTVSSETILKF